MVLLLLVVFVVVVVCVEDIIVCTLFEFVFNSFPMWPIARDI